jgi:hypothetical protein
MKKIIIFLILVLGFNFVFGQGGYLIETQFYPFQNLNTYPTAYCYQLNINNFLLFQHSFNDSWLNDCFGFPASVNYPYERSKNIEGWWITHTWRNPEFKVNNITKLVMAIDTWQQLELINSPLKNIKKLYFFKGRVEPQDPSQWRPTFKFNANYPDDLLAVFNVDLNRVSQDYYKAYYKPSNFTLLGKEFSTPFSIDYSALPGENKPKESLIVIAEGYDDNNNLRRFPVDFLTPHEDSYFLVYSFFVNVNLTHPVSVINPTNYDNHLRFSLNRSNEFTTTTHFRIKLIDKRTGYLSYDSDWVNLNLTNPPSGSQIDLDLNNYLPNFKDILINLRDTGKNELQIVLYLNELSTDNRNIVIYDIKDLNLLGGLIPTTFTYQDWYNSVIGAFGLSGATPTPIFQRAGEFIDKIFSFTALPTFNLENKGKDLAEKFNYFYSYLKTIPFISYLLLIILAFFTFRIAIRFIRLIFLR